jgi:hypothetical protein
MVRTWTEVHCKKRIPENFGDREFVPEDHNLPAAESSRIFVTAWNSLPETGIFHPRVEFSGRVQNFPPAIRTIFPTSQISRFHSEVLINNKKIVVESINHSEKAICLNGTVKPNYIFI